MGIKYSNTKDNGGQLLFPEKKIRLEGKEPHPLLPTSPGRSWAKGKGWMEVLCCPRPQGGAGRRGRVGMEVLCCPHPQGGAGRREGASVLSKTWERKGLLPFCNRISISKTRKESTAIKTFPASAVKAVVYSHHRHGIS